MQGSDTQSAYDSYRKRAYFGSLDGLRAFSIGLVLWHHRPVLFPEGTELPTVLLRGFAGVDFFFVLSGFLITTLLLREEARDGRFSIAGFYRRRILRIVPLYFLVVSLCAAWWIIVKGQGEWWSYLPYYYIFLANFLSGDIPLLAPTWSLSVEEQYYMLWPAVLLLVPALRARVWLLTALILLVILSGAGVVQQWQVLRAGVLDIRLPDPSYGAILIGSLTALILHHPRGFARAWVLFSHRATAPVLFVALIVAWQFLPDRLIGWPNLVMHALMAAILTALVVREDHALAPALRWRPIARIGTISYGLYLWHLVGRHVGVETAAAIGLEGPVAGWVALPIYLGASIAIAEVSFRWFESYFLRLKDRKNPRQRRRGLRSSG